MKIIYWIKCFGLLLCTDSLWALSMRSPATSSSSAPSSMSDLLAEHKQVWAQNLGEQPSRASGRCRQQWQKILADGKLEIFIGLGYSDALLAGRVLANDTLYRNILIQHLQAPCQLANYFLCGFSPLNPNLWGKQQGKITIYLHVFDSSVTIVDQDNRSIYAQEQEQKSQWAWTYFLHGISQADVVFYQGHSRAGGGPDFFPPKLLPDLEVDYSWYLQQKTGITRTLAALQAEGRQVQMLGLFSCDSLRHFKNALQVAAQDVTQILTLDLVEQEWVQIAMVGALNAILGGQCAAAVEKSSRLQGHQRPIVEVYNL